MEPGPLITIYFQWRGRRTSTKQVHATDYYISYFRNHGTNLKLLPNWKSLHDEKNLKKSSEIRLQFGKFAVFRVDIVT